MNLPCSAPWLTNLTFGRQASRLLDPAKAWRHKLERILRTRRGHAPSSPQYGVDGGHNALRTLLASWPSSAPEIATRIEEAIHRAEPRLRAQVQVPAHGATRQPADAVQLEVWIEIEGQQGGYLFQAILDGRGHIDVELDT